MALNFEQIKYLRDALEKHIEIARKKEALGDAENAKSGVSAASEAELEEAQDQIVKLKSLLATKREQIATLRSDITTSSVAVITSWRSWKMFMVVVAFGC